jgi:hypothetical protein
VEEEDRERQDEELPDLCEPRKNLTCYACYVAAIYEGEWFLAEICKDQSNVAKGYPYMTIKGNNSFVWGEKEDIYVALNEDIIVDPALPEPLDTRGHLGLKKKDHDRVLYQMVVVSRLQFLTLRI